MKKEDIKKVLNLIFNSKKELVSTTPINDCNYEKIYLLKKDLFELDEDIYLKYKFYTDSYGSELLLDIYLVEPVAKTITIFE